MMASKRDSRTKVNLGNSGCQSNVRVIVPSSGEVTYTHFPLE